MHWYKWLHASAYLHAEKRRTYARTSTIIHRKSPNLYHWDTLLSRFYSKTRASTCKIGSIVVDEEQTPRKVISNNKTALFRADINMKAL